MRPISSIIFDLDGTLVDSVPDVRAAMNRALADECLAPLSVDDVKSMVGGGADTMCARALHDRGQAATPERTEALRTRFIAAYRQSPAALSSLYPNVRGVLDTLSAMGMPMAICTNKPRETTEPVMAAFDLNKYFGAVVCGNDLAFKKPDPRHVAATLDAISATIDGSLFVGDSETDAHSARNSGMALVLVSHGYCHEPLHSLGADWLIDNFAEFPSLLSDWGIAIPGMADQTS